MNFERIQHLKNLTPPHGFRINFHQIFRIFFALSNQSNRKFSNRIEQISNEFQFDSTLTQHITLLVLAKQGHFKIIQKSRKEEVTFLFPVWDRWNHNKYLVQMTNPVIAISYNKLWWPSGKDTWLSHRQSGFKSRWDLFEEKFFLCLCFTKNLIPKSRNLYLSTPMDDFTFAKFCNDTH